MKQDVTSGAIAQLRLATLCGKSLAQHDAYWASPRHSLVSRNTARCSSL